MDDFFVNLTSDELKIILESLIFSACTDACAKWNSDDVQSMLELAQKLRSNLSNEFSFDNIYISDSSYYDDDDMVRKVRSLGVKTND
jgi:hypothetical protein